MTFFPSNFDNFPEKNAIVSRAKKCLDSKFFDLCGLAGLLSAQSLHSQSTRVKGPRVIHAHACRSKLMLLAGVNLFLCITFTTKLLSYHFGATLEKNWKKIGILKCYSVTGRRIERAFCKGCLNISLLRCYSVSVLHRVELKQWGHFVVVDSCCLVCAPHL